MLGGGCDGGPLALNNGIEVCVRRVGLAEYVADGPSGIDVGVADLMRAYSRDEETKGVRSVRICMLAGLRSPVGFGFGCCSGRACS